MKKAFVYKLRPTPAQETALWETLETCRWLYNYALGERKAAWEDRQASLGFPAQSAALPAMKKALLFLPAVHSYRLRIRAMSLAGDRARRGD
jgi:putative transposase